MNPPIPIPSKPEISFSGCRHLNPACNNYYILGKEGFYTIQSLYQTASLSVFYFILFFKALFEREGAHMHVRPHTQARGGTERGGDKQTPR